MTWLHRLNFYLLRWAFVRLGRVLDGRGRQAGWTLIRWPYPLGGYDGRPWRFVGGARK